MVLEWHEKMIMKVSERNLNMAILGKILMAFSLGSMFSIQLVQYGFFILIASTFIIVSNLSINFIKWYKNVKVRYTTHVKGFIGGFLLMIFLGIQSPFLPFKKYILIFGLILTIPAFRDIVGGRK